MKIDWGLIKDDLCHAAVFVCALTSAVSIGVAFKLGLDSNPNWFWLLAYPIVCGIAALIYRWTY